MSEIGILGGTFDPFHLGHLSVLESAIEEADCEKIVLLPAKVNPFKIGRKMADDRHRLAMLKIIADMYGNVEVSDFEIKEAKVSYTYHTLRSISRQRPDDRLYFIVGSDSLLSIESWHKGDELLREFSFILAPRPGFCTGKTADKLKELYIKYGTKIKVLNNRPVDVSSTEVRKALKEGRSIERYIPEPIADYIDEKGLYR